MNGREKRLEVVRNGSFSCHVLESARAAGVKIADPSAPDALAFLEYGQELMLKQEALERFWRENGFRAELIRGFIPAVQPRHYRTSSKRKASFFRGRFHLGMGYTRGGSGDGALLEPETHGRIYACLRKLLSGPKYLESAKSLNFCVIRGDEKETALIFNVFRANGDVVRNLRLLGRETASAVPELKSCFMLLDPTRSGYYLEASAREGHDRMFKKFFGPGVLAQRSGNLKLFYPPEAFSQVNGAMCGPFASAALELLAPDPDARVIDLYCGYGLLAMKAAETASGIIGMDWEGPAIRAAIANAAHLFPGKNIRFLTGAVTGESLRCRLPLPREEKEFFLLDPPRSGAGNDVIEAVAARRPRRVVAIFCGTDNMPPALRHWQANGYEVTAARVLDMFPGTLNLETMVRLEHI